MEPTQGHDPSGAVHPRFQGRVLPRPEEDLEDQGLGFDVQTLLGRRTALKAFGVGALALGLAACTATTKTADASGTSAGEIPDETAGPYPGDGSNGPDVLEQSGIVRSDIRSSFGDASGTAEGVPDDAGADDLSDLANGGAPFAGVAVYVWHCDREGSYSMYSERRRRTRTTCAACRSPTPTARCASPASSPPATPGAGRTSTSRSTPTRPASPTRPSAIATSQVALPQDVCDTVYATDRLRAVGQRTWPSVSLASDNVFGDDGGASQLATVTGDVDQRLHGRRSQVGVDTPTTPTGGSMPGGAEAAPAAGTARRPPAARAEGPAAPRQRRPRIHRASSQGRAQQKPCAAINGAAASPV